MAGHTRLFRRGATYYLRAANPKDIEHSYSKSEETFSLKTKVDTLSREQITQARMAYYFLPLEEDDSIQFEDGLWNDPATGVMRHAVTGYNTAKIYAKENNLNLPRILE